VCGLCYDPDRRTAGLLIEAWALPEHGPVDPDLRRVVVMSAVSSLEVWLRPDERGGLGAVLELQSLEELECFFQSLGAADAMHGWSFVDAHEPWGPVSGPPSLALTASERPALHTLCWFADCRRSSSAETETFLLAGLIGFAELDVRRADGTVIGAERFAEDGARWWRAFDAHDARTGVDAQRQLNASATHWRTQGDAGGVIIPA